MSYRDFLILNRLIEWYLRQKQTYKPLKHSTNSYSTLTPLLLNTYSSITQVRDDKFNIWRGPVEGQFFIPCL